MRFWGPVAAICLALAAVHAWLVWGYVSEFWGDTGRWMHEVDRFAQGERLYVDFTWPFPPLAMWILGNAAKVVGTGVHQLWGLTCAMYFGVVLVFLRYLFAVVPRDLALGTAVASVIGAFAYAQVGSAPLPLGMYSPAAPIGGFFLLMAVGGLVAVIEGDTRAVTAIIMGLSASLAVLTKQDFWAPALVTVLFGLCYALPRHRAVIGAAAVVPSMLGYGLLAYQLGPADFLAMLGGFGHAAEFGDMGLPSGRRLAAEVGATSLTLWVGLLVSGTGLRRWSLLAAALSVAAVLAYVIEEDLQGLRLLQEDVLRRGFSLALPAVVLVWLWTARQAAHPRQVHLARIRLVVCLAARLRRGFQGVEWYHILLELPIYALALRAVLGEQRIRLQQAGVAALIPLGMYLHWHFGRGPLTERGRLSVEVVETTRGRILLRPNAAGDYHFAATALATLDPQAAGRSLPSVSPGGGITSSTDGTPRPPHTDFI